MLTFAWGPQAWDHLLMVAFTYPKDNPSPKQQQRMVSFLTAFMDHLPCPGCKVHAGMYVRSTPPDVSSQDALVQWVVTFHNEVNKRTSKGKKRSDWTVDEARKALIERNFGDQSGLVRANAVRREDHVEIQKLRQYIRSLERECGREPSAFVESGYEKHIAAMGLLAKPGDTTPGDPSTDNNVGNSGTTTAILVLSIVILVVGLLTAAGVASIRYKTNGTTTNVQRESSAR